MVISISFGGLLEDYYTQLTGFGISKVRVDRRGQDSTLTQLWMDRVSDSKEIIIVGTLSKGWFDVAYENLDALIETKSHLHSIKICLLDPFGNVWRSKIESRQNTQAQFLEDASLVFRNLTRLARKHSKKVKVLLYDDEPISCVVAGGAIYLAPYLPRTERKESPELTISQGSFLGDKVYEESVKKLPSSSLDVGYETLARYVKIMENHIPTKSNDEAFWNDPAIYCDFCKEFAGLFSALSRRYPSLSTRIATQTKNFFVVPSFGQLIKNHALIISNRHLTSSAQLEATPMSELEKLMEQFQKSAAKNKTTQIFFEHGLPNEGSGFGGCGICDCHIHSVPVASSEFCSTEKLQAFMNEKGISFTPNNLDSRSGVHKWAKHPYLCVKAGEGSPILYTFPYEQRVPSQLMRQFLAGYCPGADKNWDWRSKVDDQNAFNQTVSDLKTIFNEAAV